MRFEPDYRNLVKAANNIKVERIPLYEHIIAPEVMEKITGKKFAECANGSDADMDFFFQNFCGFFRDMGYDTVSYEQCVTGILPGGGALAEHAEGVIRDRDDFDRYPWEELEEMYFRAYSRRFEALRRNMPEGMKAVGGVGNGVFECVEDLTGYLNLCYMRTEDPELFADLFVRVGQILNRIWKRFLKEYGDILCVCRFGDDLGFKTSTLLSPNDIREFIVPQYAPIIESIHRAGKPFLLHSCGCIFDVMDALIDVAKIDAKHSNEDQIARFPVWVEKYGNRIGNFGGIDTDCVGRMGKENMREYIADVVGQCRGHGGFAFGSGNSIPNYTVVEGYVDMPKGFANMNEIIRDIRGDFK